MFIYQHFTIRFEGCFRGILANVVEDKNKLITVLYWVS